MGEGEPADLWALVSVTSARPICLRIAHILRNDITGTTNLNGMKRLSCRVGATSTIAESS